LHVNLYFGAFFQHITIVGMHLKRNIYCTSVC
jgi:hypothetical protein